MIHDAARTANKEKFARLVSKLGKDCVTKKERDYEQTPLHVACDAGRTEIVQLLLEKYKVEVNPVDKNGWTPLHHAAASAQLPICEILLKAGASARALSNEGASPLHYLVRHNPTDPALFARVLQLMLLNRADVNQQNKHGETPLHQAAHRGRETVVQQLLSAGATVAHTTKHGETPLHFAVRAGQKGVVSALLAAGADPTAVSTSGTPLELAKPSPEISEILKRMCLLGEIYMIPLLLLLFNRLDLQARSRNSKKPRKTTVRRVLRSRTSRSRRRAAAARTSCCRNQDPSCSSHRQQAVRVA